MPIRPTDNPEILNMRGLNLFHYSYSNCSMRIRLFLDEKGIPWNDHFIDLRAQKNLTEEYFAIHPQGLVPALVDDGVIVYESADILEYLEEKFPEPSFTPDTAEGRAELIREPSVAVASLQRRHEWIHGAARAHEPEAEGDVSLRARFGGPLELGEEQGARGCRATAPEQ